MDTSVLLKWFHAEGEPEAREADAIRAAHVAGDITVHVLDLALYELGNVLTRALGWSADAVADQLDDVVTMCGAPLILTVAELRDAAFLAGEHGLSFYDAAWAAAARALAVPLVSADQQLLMSGLAESATGFARRLNLSRS
ncbi:MAG: type II toxin-antitoxin system VapC family toxin [Actinomycetes bacterium]